MSQLKKSSRRQKSATKEYNIVHENINFDNLQLVTFFLYFQYNIQSLMK